MFARTLKIVGAAIALIVGNACRGYVDCSCTNADTFIGVARGVNVVPAAADTSGRAAVIFNVATLAYTYSVTTQPAGTIDSIALYEVSSGDTLPASATAILCAGAAACGATSGTARVAAPATTIAQWGPLALKSRIGNSMRAYGTQLVFFTTTAQKAAGGAMRGTMYLNP